MIRCVIPYGWPLAPFDRPHPVRANFNDPRIAGLVRAFHFGIDISGANGTAVHSVSAGVAHLQNARAVAVVDGEATFGYWHVVPAVRSGQRVVRPQVIGHIESPWLHVHFAESRRGEYRNPLRRGALTPWRDTTTPHVTRVTFERDGHALPPNGVAGPVDVVAEAHDDPSIPVPPPWDGLPVTPARLRWRVLRGDRVVRPWHTPVDLATHFWRQPDFERIYAPGTRQNHANEPGLYRFYLARTWSTRLLPDGEYVVEVEASDLDGNAGVRRTGLTLLNDV